MFNQTIQSHSSKVKNYLQIILFLLFSNIIFAQEDSLFLKQTQDLKEVSFSAFGQIIFEAQSIYLLDFHVDETGKYLLLKGRKNYFISRLDENSAMKSNYLLNFKPNRLFRDCMGSLYVISKDSIYKVDEASEEIGIFEPNPIAFFIDNYAYCETETENHLVYKSLSNSNQVVTFNAIAKQFQIKKMFYETQDTVQVTAANDWEKNIEQDHYDFEDQMGEVGVSSLGEIRKKFQRLMFYNMIISKPDYTPLFHTKNEVYIFDHYIDSLVRFTSTDMRQNQSLPISYHKNKGWQKEILFDKATNTFYTTFYTNGKLYLSELSNTDFSIVKSIKIYHNVFNKHMMVHDGYVYYDFKKSRDAAYNKLFRQRL